MLITHTVKFITASELIELNRQSFNIPLIISKIKRWLPFNISRFVTTNYLLSLLANHLIFYPTPAAISYAWSFGSLAGITLIIQIVSGLFLSMFYTADIKSAFHSVNFIMREVPQGWLVRYIHANGASMFFFVVYVHMRRGLYCGSCMALRQMLWCSGVVLLFFLGITIIKGHNCYIYVRWVNELATITIALVYWYICEIDLSAFLFYHKLSFTIHSAFHIVFGLVIRPQMVPAPFLPIYVVIMCGFGLTNIWGSLSDSGTVTNWYWCKKKHENDLDLFGDVNAFTYWRTHSLVLTFWNSDSLARAITLMKSSLSNSVSFSDSGLKDVTLVLAILSACLTGGLAGKEYANSSPLEIKPYISGAGSSLAYVLIKLRPLVECGVHLFMEMYDNCIRSLDPTWGNKKLDQIVKESNSVTELVVKIISFIFFR